MRMENKIRATKFILSWIKFIILVVLIYSVFIVFHEQTHKALFENYDCKNITIDINWPGGYAFTSATCQYNADLIYLQSITDIVGYASLFVFSILIIVYSEYLDRHEVEE